MRKKSCLTPFIHVDPIHSADIPWQMVASLHYREADFKTSVSRPGGPFQNDPPGQYAGENDFANAAKIAAVRLQEKVGGMLSRDTTDQELIKDAFWGYNGRAKWHVTYDGSSYVMNKFDANHMGPTGEGMLIKGTVRRPDGSKEYINRADAKYGAWPVYQQLKGLYK